MLAEEPDRIEVLAAHLLSLLLIEVMVSTISLLKDGLVDWYFSQYADHEFLKSTTATPWISTATPSMGDGTPVDPCPEGESCDVGVDNSAGHRGVTVEGGLVRQFGVGVLVTGGAARTRLQQLAVSHTTDYGVILIFFSVMGFLVGYVGTRSLLTVIFETVRGT